MRRGAVALAVLWALVMLSGCRFGEDRQPPDERRTRPPTARAKRGPFRVTVDEVGVIQARSSVEVSAPFWGKVLQLLPEGTTVSAGDPVLWMDTSERERRLERVEADLRAARGQLDKHLERLRLRRKQTELDLARSEANLRFEETKLESRRQELSDAERRLSLELVSVASVDQKRRALRQAGLDHARAELGHRRKVEEAKSQERRIEVDRREAERRFSRQRRRHENVQREVEQSLVRAPTAGRIFYPKVYIRGSAEQRKVRVGDQVSSWTGPVLALPDLSTLEVRSQVDETLVARVVPGVLAVVRVTAIEEVRLGGSVAEIALLAVPRSKSDGAGFSDSPDLETEQVVFPLTVTLDEADERLQPGMTVAVSFVLETLDEAVSVPRAAVIGTGSAAVVFVRRVGGFTARSVRLGPTSGDRVVVTDGLQGGEVVFLGDPRGVMEGAGAGGRASALTGAWR